MRAEEASALTAAAQQLMKAEADIEVDGKWGSYTQSIYDKLSARSRLLVDSLLKAGGVQASDLRARRMNEKASGVSKARAASSVREAIEAAAEESGVPLATMMAFAKIESNFNPRAVNGSSRGLFQMQPAAWKDAARFVRDLPPYEEAVFDPVQNSRAASGYIRNNMLMLRRLGYDGPLSAAALYLAHQQGAGGFVELWKTANDKPNSGKLVTVRAMTGNPPQDGQGVTTDKREFFRRWLAVAERKVAEASA